MRLVNTFIIAMYSIVNYSLLRQILIAFYAKLNEISEIEFHFALEVSFSIYFIMCSVLSSVGGGSLNFCRSVLVDLIKQFKNFHLLEFQRAGKHWDLGSKLLIIGISLPRGNNHVNLFYFYHQHYHQIWIL